MIITSINLFFIFFAMNLSSLVLHRSGDPNWVSPLLFVIGGWMYMEWQKEEAWDEED